jgi:hypothetical protein
MIAMNPVISGHGWRARGWFQHEHALFGLSTLSRHSAWAVGATGLRACSDQPVSQPLTLRWNGRRWAG